MKKYKKVNEGATACTEKSGKRKKITSVAKGKMRKIMEVEKKQERQ